MALPSQRESEVEMMLLFQPYASRWFAAVLEVRNIPDHMPGER
jgi:hypothetical protein